MGNAVFGVTILLIVAIAIWIQSERELRSNK